MSAPTAFEKMRGCRRQQADREQAQRNAQERHRVALGSMGVPDAVATRIVSGEMTLADYHRKLIAEAAPPARTPVAHHVRIAWWIATHTPAGLMALGMLTGAVLCAVAILFVL